MKVIFGSGIVGLLARFLLGDSWTIVPFYRSRFYSFNPPLDDNFLIADTELDSVLSELGQSTLRIWLQRAYSVGGELIKNDVGGTLGTAWLTKLFGNDYPQHAPIYLSARTGFFVYGDVRVTGLYRLLQERFDSELRTNSKLGVPTEIGDHYFVRGGVRHEFDRAVSTIPLSALLGLMNRQSTLRYKPYHVIHMATTSLNFEGATQVLVVDSMFSFYKVTILAKGRYMFHCHENIPDAGSYFMPILADYDLLDGTEIKDGIPIGPRPDLKWLEQMDIFPVGGYAQHDWCADVSSNLLRLSRYAGRGEKPKNSIIVM